MKRTLEYSLTCFVGISAYLFWAVGFRSMLNYHEEFQLFQTDGNYLWAHLTQMGGTTVYVAEWLVQFYNNVWIGALVLAIEFMTMQWLTLRCLQLMPWDMGCRYAHILTCVVSLVPLALVWIALGDINVMHSLIVAVILALALLYVLLRTTRGRTARCVGGIVAIAAYVWMAGTSHYRIPGMMLSLGNIYHPKTLELLDYDMLVRANRWEDIIRKAEGRQPDLPMSVCATNLALGMTNELCNRGQEFFQNGTEGLFPSFTKDPFSTLTTAEVYFQLGLINTAQRFYFEAMEAAPNYGKSCRCIRRLAETSVINGQYEVARKYLGILEKTLFYRKWARRTMALIDQGEEAVMQHSLYGHMRRMKLTEDVIFSDKEIDKICGRLMVRNPDNVLATQYLLFHPVLANDHTRFMQYMKLVKETKRTK